MLSFLLALVVISFWLLLIYPFTLTKKPAYTISEAGLGQNRKIFKPKFFLWESISKVTFPGGYLRKDMSSVNIIRRSSFIPLVINLSEIQDPYIFLEIINRKKPFIPDITEARVYFQQNMDRDKFVYITVAYSLFAIPILLLALYYMPYILLEDNIHNKLWGSLFVIHWIWSTVMSFFMYRNISSRNSYIQLSALLWILILIGPFFTERNIYYNIRAITSENEERYREAESYIRKAIQLNPDGYSYYETLGKTLYGLEDYYGSIDAFNHLLENDERNTDYYVAYYHLWKGKAFLKLGKIEDARSEFEQVKKANSSKLYDEVKVLLKSSDLE